MTNGVDNDPVPGHPWLVKSASEVMTTGVSEEIEKISLDPGPSDVISP
ncbi:MAG: hypothetical protein KGD60_01690 [Candidatus Thorarchaeota archaeon]|nr:hypothetical protein [Candidatus Thorarchaeota archaeon]